MERYLSSRITDPKFNSRASQISDQFWSRPSWEEAINLSRSNASLKREREEAKGRCWSNYEPTPGKEAYSDGSCQPTGGKKRKKHKKKRKSKNHSGESSTDTDSEPKKKKDKD